MRDLYGYLRPGLFRLDPERAHELSIRALKLGLPIRRDRIIDRRLALSVAGLRFDNPLGLAAGYDKNAEVPDAVLRLGFGFTEVGTLTPQPQEGNPRPRVFRLPEHRALINRLGFNNDGHADAFGRLVRRHGRLGIVGVNIGANKNSEDRIADYVEGVSVFGPVAKYLTVNISSPNTPGLRALQKGTELDRLLRAVVAARDGEAALSASPPVPIFVKVAPDLDEAEIAEIAETVPRRKIDGLIVTNTTLDRSAIAGDRHAGEAGGLSGAPLYARSTRVLARFRKLVGPHYPLIGVGGVDSTETLIGKIEAGADLVQLYTGLVYGGPDLPNRILSGLLAHLKQQGAQNVRDLRDRRVEEILAAPEPA